MANSFSRSGSLAFLLGMILAVAGLLHLMEPAAFMPLMPPWMPAPFILIYATGVLELFAAMGLRQKALRRTTALWVAVYFLAIWPVHFYAAVYSIPIFGNGSPAFLWGRVGFQVVFIAWALWIAVLAKREGLGPSSGNPSATL